MQQNLQRLLFIPLFGRLDRIDCHYSPSIVIKLSLNQCTLVTIINFISDTGCKRWKVLVNAPVMTMLLY